MATPTEGNIERLLQVLADLLNREVTTANDLDLVNLVVDAALYLYPPARDEAEEGEELAELTNQQKAGAVLVIFKRILREEIVRKAKELEAKRDMIAFAKSSGDSAVDGLE